MAQGVLESHFIPSSHMSVSPWPHFPLPFSTSTCPSPSSSHLPLSWCTLSSTPTLVNPEQPCNTTCATSAKGSNDAYDVTVSLTGYEPKRHGLQRARQLPGFLLLRYPVIGPGHRRHYARQARSKKHTENMPITAVREGVSVRQSSLSVVFDRTGKPVGERNVDQSIGFGVTRNT